MVLPPLNPQNTFKYEVGQNVKFKGTSEPSMTITNRSYTDGVNEYTLDASTIAKEKDIRPYKSSRQLGASAATASSTGGPSPSIPTTSRFNIGDKVIYTGNEYIVTNVREQTRTTHAHVPPSPGFYYIITRGTSRLTEIPEAGLSPSISTSVVPKYKVGDTLIMDSSVLSSLFPGIGSAFKPKIKGKIKAIGDTDVTVEINLKNVLTKEIYDALPDGTAKIMESTESTRTFEASLLAGHVKIESSNMAFAIGIILILYVITR